MTNLVAIPSATETSSRLHRNVIIGTSIGIALFFLLATVATLLAVRRWRQRATTRLSSEPTELPRPFQEPGALIVHSPCEIDQSSLVGPLRELHDCATAKVELLNEQNASGSGNEIPEMPEALRTVPQEPRTDRSSRVMVQTRTANRWKIFTPTKNPRKSWTSFASSSGSPHVETVISASTQQRDTNRDRASIGTSNLAEIYAYYTQKSFDLDRSLPPTPISESPQVSPVLAEFGQGSSFCRRPQMSETSARDSLSAFISPKMPISKYPMALSKTERFPMNVLSTGRKTTYTFSQGNGAPMSQEPRSFREMA